MELKSEFDITNVRSPCTRKFEGFMEHRVRF